MITTDQTIWFSILYLKVANNECEGMFCCICKCLLSTHPKNVTLLKNKDKRKKWERKSQTGEERGRKKNSTKKAETKPTEENVIGI